MGLSPLPEGRREEAIRRAKRRARRRTRRTDRREKLLKTWKRAWKIELIERANPRWRDLWDDIIF